MSSVRVALVTGAAQGIGRAVALRLASDGYNVAINDIASNTELLETVKREVLAVYEGQKTSETEHKCITTIADISKEEQVKGMIEHIVQELGGLDALVANAGVCITKSFFETTTQDLERVIDINVIGTFLCYKYAGMQMVKQGRGGRIVGASSVAGKRGAVLYSAYSTSKFAIRGLTQTLAMEIGKHGITVNAYVPGAIDTEMLRETDTQYAAIVEGAKPGDIYKLHSCSLGYMGETSDVANLVSFLVSENGRYITGQSIACDGGITFS